MRVGVDARAVAPRDGGDVRQARGITRYVRGLLGALGESSDDEWLLLVAKDAGEIPPELERMSNVRVVRDRLRARALYAASAAGLAPLDRRLGARLDVMWLPAPAPGVVSRRTPLAVTVHDLSFEHRPQDFGRYERLWHRASRPRRAAGRAATVLTVSEATRAEATRAWGLDSERVRVVPLGLDHAAARPDDASAQVVRRRLGLPERYLLYVGALEPRKAPGVLVDAHRLARTRGLVEELVVVGQGPLAMAVSGPDVHMLGRVDDGDLRAVYAGAVALVSPSQLEGFGLTPLEAALAGTPSVVSDLPALRETLDDAALLVEPGDVEGFAEAILAITRDAALRDRLARRARIVAAGFTWERSARLARAALAEAASRGR